MCIHQILFNISQSKFYFFTIFFHYFSLTFLIFSLINKIHKLTFLIFSQLLTFHFKFKTKVTLIFIKIKIIEKKIVLGNNFTNNAAYYNCKYNAKYCYYFCLKCNNCVFAMSLMMFIFIVECNDLSPIGVF